MVSTDCMNTRPRCSTGNPAIVFWRAADRMAWVATWSPWTMAPDCRSRCQPPPGAVFSTMSNHPIAPPTGLVIPTPVRCSPLVISPGLSRPSGIKQRLADGREFLTLPPANGRSATILSASNANTNQRRPGAGTPSFRLDRHGPPNQPSAMALPDQYVLAGELMTLDFVVSDDVDPPEFLNVNASFLSTPLLIDFQSLALSGTGTIRTLVAQTLTGFPDGSENLEVSVTNSQGVDAVAPFEVFVLETVPSRRSTAGLGLAGPDRRFRRPCSKFRSPPPPPDLLFDAESLTYQATSSDQTLLPDSALLLNGDGSGRLLSIQTAPGQGGQTTISVEVTNPLGRVGGCRFCLDHQHTRRHTSHQRRSRHRRPGRRGRRNPQTSRSRSVIRSICRRIWW